MKLDEALLVFGKNMNGQLVRGQKVESVELAMDSLCENGSLRYLIYVYFCENPIPKNTSKEKTLLLRVFDDKPHYARVCVNSHDQAIAILTHVTTPDGLEWILEDEHYEPQQKEKTP